MSPDPVQPKRRYADTRLGQMHLTIWPGPADATLPPIVCVHPVPYSGRYFDGFAAGLSRHVSVIAPDLPGYGGSDPLAEPVGIADYAAATADALQNLGIGRYVPLGYHVGSVVAGELALARPKRVPAMVFVGYPFLSEEERAKQRSGLGSGIVNGEDLESLRRRWRATVNSRAAGVRFEPAFVNFVEELRAGENAWFGFHATFHYPMEQRLAKICQPVFVVNGQGSMKAPTEAAVERLADSNCIEMAVPAKGIFELQPDRLAFAITQWLGTVSGSGRD